MKSKIKFLLTPILALAVAATAFFGYANFNTPAKASADSSTTIHLYLGSTNTYTFRDTNLLLQDYAIADAKLYVYAWQDGNDAIKNANFPGVEVTVVNDWVDVDLGNAGLNRLIVSRVNPNDLEEAWNETVTIEFSYDYPCFYNNRWYKTKKQIDMVLNRGWYLIGKINGAEESFIDSTTTYLTTATAEGKNAVWNNVELKQGDKIKAVHSDEAPNMSDLKGLKASIDGVCTRDTYGNAVIAYDGIYNIWVDSSWNLDIERANAEAINFAETKYKATTSGTNYALLATAFDLGDVGEGNYSIGYYVKPADGDATMYTTTTYYSGITAGAKTWSLTGGENNIYDSISGDFADAKLIVYEFAAEIGKTYTVQAYVMKDGVVVATGATKNITPFPA